MSHPAAPPRHRWHLLVTPLSTAVAGAAVNKPVGVCGEAAADPLLACVLVGMGVTSLSSAPAAAAGVGAALADVTLAQCRAAARAALATADPGEARVAAADALHP